MDTPRLPGPGVIAQCALQDALANVGTHEVGGNNLGPSVHQYLQATVPPTPDGSPWCASFVTMRLRTAAHELGGILPDDFCRSGYVPDWVNWAKSHGCWIPASRAAEAGGADLVCYDFQNIGECHHIGFIVHNLGASLLTCEGNTSPSASDAVERDGDGRVPDGVYKKQRSLSALGQGGGFIRLAL